MPGVASPAESDGLLVVPRGDSPGRTQLWQLRPFPGRARPWNPLRIAVRDPKLARRVSHRNVCRLHDFGSAEGQHYVCMAYVEGVDLKRVLASRGALPPDGTYDVCTQLAEGLQAIHDEGIVHRDLKSSNIMIDPRGVARLMDFGIAKSVEPGLVHGVTATGVIVGTPEYMSPEQALGGRVDTRSDLYSLGVVIFEVFRSSSTPKARATFAASPRSSARSSRCESSSGLASTGSRCGSTGRSR